MNNKKIKIINVIMLLSILWGVIPVESIASIIEQSDLLKLNNQEQISENDKLNIDDLNESDNDDNSQGIVGDEPGEKETIINEDTETDLFVSEENNNEYSLEEDRYFIFQADTNTIIGYSADVNAPKNIKIPNQINGVDVLHIANNAFAGQQLVGLELNTNLISIGDNAFQNNFGISGSLLIPESVENIGYNAFQNTNLNEINIPSKLEGSLNYYPWGVDVNVTDIYWKDVVDVGSFIFNTTTNTLIKFKGTEKTLTIPASYSVDGTNFAVNHIKDGLFSGKNITEISLPNSLLTIGQNAFANTKLAKLDIPNSVTSIGSGVLSGSNLLVEVKLSNSVSVISDNAFSSTGLTTINLNDNLKTIGNNSFANTKLVNVTIPNSVETIGAGAFSNISTLNNVNLGTTLTEISDELFLNSSISSITIPNGVTSIGNKVFNNTKLVNVEIPNSVTVIGNESFANIASLSNVMLGSGLTAISDSLFSNSGISNIVIPDSVEVIGSNVFSGTKIIDFVIPNSVVTISNSAFSNMEALKEINIPTKLSGSIEGDSWGAEDSVIIYWKDVVKVYPFVFNTTTKTIVNYIGNGGSVIIPDTFNIASVEYPVVFLKERLFLDNEDITSVNIGNNLEEISKNSFSGTSKLRSVVIGSGVKIIEDNAFSKSAITSVQIPNNTEEIGSSAFMDTESLKNVIIGTGVTKIGSSAFKNSGIENFIIPNNVTEIGDGIFASSTLVTISIGTGISSIPQEAFSGTKLETITIPNGVIEINDSAFADTTLLKNVNIGTGVTKIGASAFKNSSIENITIPNNVLEIGSGIFESSTLENISLGTGISIIPEQAFSKTKVKLIEIPNVVVEIKDKAFEGTKIETIEIPDSVTTIAPTVFSSTTNLKEIHIPTKVSGTINSAPWGAHSSVIVYWKDVVKVEPYVFSTTTNTIVNYFGNDKDLVIPDKFVVSGIDFPVLHIGDKVFAYAQIENVKLPENLQTIGKESFLDTRYVKNVDFNQNLKSIGQSAFQGSKLKNLYLPNSVTSLGESSFDSTGLDNVTIGEGITTIPKKMFMNATVYNIDLGRNVKTIDEYAFFNTRRIPSLQIPASVRSIKNGAFQFVGAKEINFGSDNIRIDAFAFQQSQLESLNIVGSANFHIGQSAFSHTPNLKDVKISGVSLIPFGAFVGSNLTSLEIIGNGNTKIYSRAFMNTPNLVNAKINGVDEIGMEAFLNSGIKKVQIEGIGNTVIKDSAFKNTSGLNDVSLGDGISNIGSMAFQNSGFKSIQIPDSVTFIANLAFADSLLETVSVGNGITRIREDAFSNNPNLKTIFIYLSRIDAPNEVINYQPWGAVGADVYYLGEFVTFEHEINTVEKEYARNIDISAFIESGKLINYIITPTGETIYVGGTNWPTSGKYSFKVTENDKFTFVGADTNGLITNYDINITDIGKPTLTANDFEFTKGDIDTSTFTKNQILSLVDAKATTIELGDDFNGGSITMSDADLKLFQELSVYGGTINVTLTAESPTGLTDSINVKITCKTNEKPVLSGLNELTIKKGLDVDLKLGVSASDLEDGDLTSEIVFPSINTSTLEVGVHVLEYSVTDSAGNKTTENRTIKVLSNNAPILVGADDMTIKVSEVDTFDLLAGITISDDHDDLTTADIVVTGRLGKPIGGTTEVFNINYSVTDSDGNKTSVDRKITVTNEKPTLTGLSEITIKQGQSIYLKNGVFANDLEDGDITNKIVYPTQSTIISRIFKTVLDTSSLAEGTHELEYSITDTDGNVTTEKRTIKVLSNNSPIIIGADDVTIKISEVDAFDLLAGITISDDHDNLTIANLIVTGTLGKPVGGTTQVYNINYSVTDSDGNQASVDRKITVTNQKPNIDSLSEIVIKKGQIADLKIGVSATDLEDGDITNKIVYPTLITSTLEEGVHVLEYSVTDSDGNKTTENRTINVLSNNAPIIVGAADVTIKVSEVDAFNLLAGITIFDDHDTLTSDDLVVTGTLGKPVGGTTQVYTINYSVTDSDGNISSVDRKISVTNQQPSLTGLNEVTIKQGQSIDLKVGVFANDLEDGNITNKIVYPTHSTIISRIFKTVLDTSTLAVGTHEVEYSITDTDGNVTTGKRTIKVLTNNAPTLIVGPDTTIKVSQVDTFNLLSGISVNDDHDNLTVADVVVTGNLGKPLGGTTEVYNIKYVVIDSDGNETSITRKITVTNQKPTLNGLNELVIKKGQDVNLALGVSAADLEDVDITDKIVFPTENTSTLTVGTHQLVYSVTDSDGNITSETRSIIVLSDNAPTIIGANDTTIKVSEVDTFDLLAGITISDDHDNLTSADLVVTGVLEKPAGGTIKVYNINYSVTDSDGNTTSSTRKITVTNEKPTLSGLSDVVISFGQEVDLKIGVNSNDLEDGDITTKIVYPIGNTSSLTVGTHHLEYSVTDSDGNITSETRSINVLSDNAPIIIGANDVIIKVSEVDAFNLLAGITISDDHDTLTSADLVITGTLGKPVGGTTQVYNINYSVTDSDGNTTSVDRKITVTNEKPSLNGLSEVFVRKGQLGDLKIGVSALDLEDGDITNKVVYPTVNTSSLEIGEHIVEYSITDSDGNISTGNRTIKVLSNNAPIVIGADDVTLKVSEVDTFDLLSGITISDDHDNLTVADIVITGSLEKPLGGTTQVYNINYSVTDSDGNVTSIDRKITVTNQKSTLSGLSDVTIKQGQSIDLKDDVFAFDLEDGDITNKIVYPTQSTIISRIFKAILDTSTLAVGTHELEYSITDTDGNTSTETRIITVLTNNSPTLLVGDDVTIRVSEVDTFDLLDGITINDDHDAVTVADVIVTGSLGKPIGGSKQVYNINYSVTDSDGNITSVDRKITVTNEKPSLSGLTKIEIEKGQEFNLKSGVNATDLEDGDLTNKILISTVKTSSFETGEHVVSYSVTDSDGNSTVEVRNVKVTSQGSDVTTDKNDGSGNQENNELVSTGFVLFDLKIISFALIALVIIRRVMFGTSK